jgi:hypothetical protein
VIRFVPDTLLEGVLRPVAMALPNGAVYVETIAPDFRFVFAIALLVAWLALRVGRQGARSRVLLLFGFCALTFVPWLATSGNGRYFVPTLLLVGPLAVALLYHLPFTPQLRLALAAAMLLLQVFLVHENEPWNSWGLVPWTQPPAFGIAIPEDVRREPATYVTLSSISYSLIAPGFHPDSRWINLASQGNPNNAPDFRRTADFLARAPRPHVLFPSLPGEGRGAGAVPQADLVEALDLSLVEHRLKILPNCRFLASPGLTAIGSKLNSKEVLGPADQRGFWLCPLVRMQATPERPAPFKASPQSEAAFGRIEQLCPRMFPGGEAITTLLPVGARRLYPGSDMRLYVLDDGRVMYKYIRALNMVLVGSVQEVLAPAFRMDCQVRGRGLPWEREI